MAVSSRAWRERGARVVALAAGLVALVGCSRGEGEGEVTGVVSDPECGLASYALDLQPNFFAAEEAGDAVEIRLQHGSYFALGSDGLSITVTDAANVQASLLGVPLAFEPTVAHVPPTTPVTMTLYLNETCSPRSDRQATVLVAESGTITFDALWVPDADGGREITASFSAVHLVDPADPANRYADLDGYFTFLYARGRPAQPFP